jgi:hypothetical protein
MFELVKVDFETMEDPLAEFYHQCQLEGNINNSSQKAMKVGVFENEHWWAYSDRGKIISISGCHPSDDFGSGGWRLLFRSATLNDYRSKAGKFSRDLNHDFCFGHLLKVQIDFAKKQGASRLFFTTNSSSDGYQGSLKADKIVENVLLPMGKVKLIESNYTYFYCKQNIWEVV